MCLFIIYMHNPIWNNNYLLKNHLYLHLFSMSIKYLTVSNFSQAFDSSILFSNIINSKLTTKLNQKTYMLEWSHLNTNSPSPYLWNLYCDFGEAIHVIKIGIFRHLSTFSDKLSRSVLVSVLSNSSVKKHRLCALLLLKTKNNVKP